MLASFDVGSGEAMEEPDFWLKRSHTHQAREVQEPEKNKNTNWEIGERWNGRGGSKRRGSELTQTGTRFETLMPG